MASTSAAEQALWQEGDRCLAPNPRDGILREATIQRLTSTSHNNDTAWVTFSDFNTDAKEEEELEVEKAIPVLELMRPGLNHFTREKPLFPSSVIDPKLCTPLELSDIDEDKVPYTINRYLRDYQREGIRFIYNNYIRSSGCILGDDMGLGKTVQVIGFLAAVLHKTGTWEDIKNNRPQFLQSQMPSKQSNCSKAFLIVAPLSVLYNWKEELETWGHFRCVVVHGLRKEEELGRIKKGRIEIALTTYETLRLCLDQFNNIDWAAVVVDEAHKIKNPNSQITQAMKELKCKVRIGLTGTILQNNLEELWCVMDWAVPGCLGSLGQFKNKFSDPIEQGQKHSATKRALATGRKTVKSLVKKISHCFFRRTKALIKEQLPKKDDRVVYCALSDFQQTVYQAVLDTEEVTLMLRSSEKCACQSGRTRRSCCDKTNPKVAQIKNLYFSYLAILRKVANHAALLQSTAGTSKKQEKYVSEICAKVFQKFPDFVQRCKNEAFEALSDPMYSGKMKVLQKLLKYYLQKRDKVLIFSFSTKLLDVLESYCMAEGLDFSRLDGSTKSKVRVQIVKDFNSSSHINICLVSTMAGGLGLNFVGANVVVLFDPTWNPANDLQAIDRAYRIGQCRDVTVLRLISLGTVEEVIYLRQVYKQQLQCSVVGKESTRRYFEAVQGHGVHKGELFGIKNLFRLQTQGTCLTRRILEREGKVEAGVIMTSTHRGEEKEEEETTGVREPTEEGQPTKETRIASTLPRGVLDFSSGSDEDEELGGLKWKASNLSVDDSNRSGNAATSPVRISLLQQGFSRLLERVQVKPDSEEGDSSSDVKGSLSDGDSVDKKRVDTPSDTRSGEAGLLKLKTKLCDTSVRKHGENGDGWRQDKVNVLKDDDNAARRQGLKRGINEEITVGEGSNENCTPRKRKASKPQTAVHHFEGCSDESEDFDLETKTFSKKDTHNRRERGSTDHNRKKKSASIRDKARSRYTDDIETFTSSEDEHTSPQSARSRHGKKSGINTTEKGMPKMVSLRGPTSQTSPASKEKCGTIDSVLGGVQEVVYTHSNQRVVGGSKAEELISKAAVRDVFEHQMYSQLPANHLLGTQESLTESQPSPLTLRLQKHPVIFTSKSVHHTRHTTFIIGETPKAIRRQQLEEMAEKFKFPSPHQFAAEILSRNPTQRLTWLHQYYTSLNYPDLTNTVTNNFPQDVSAQTSTTATFSPCTQMPAPETRTLQKDVQKATKKTRRTQKNLESRTTYEMPQNHVTLPQKKSRTLQTGVLEPPKMQKISQKNVLEPHPGPESEETVSSARGHKRTKRGSVSTSGADRAGGGLGVDQANNSGLGSGEAAAFLNHIDRDTPSSSDLSHGRFTMASKPTAQGSKQQESSSRTTEALQKQTENSQSTSIFSKSSFLTDLIGDTSILDDLLKSRPKSTQQRTNPRAPPIPSVSVNTTSQSRISTDTDSSSHTQMTHRVKTPAQASKVGRKDFWDILNEGNEESINRLTDPDEVQRVCITANFAARSRFGQESDKESLWKTNDKFLWKK
ncbi:DNA excision repair protein ERCC-6-like 2 [Parambassis ranga]|uniref:DNA excision repair protein ERCC-6-like 2 n=1 Tax=Parambassis ranga TaxID=210632 RepID=A0A6P7J2X3_9TELE|nr:DNA excision repair protein ERCC-6-like 2 [Parambassis ranga]